MIMIRAFTFVDLHHLRYTKKHPFISSLLQSLSRLSVLAILGLCLLLLVIASYFTIQPDALTLVMVYMTQVLLPATLYEIIMDVTVMYPYAHMNISLFSGKTHILIIGKRSNVSLKSYIEILLYFM